MDDLEWAWDGRDVVQELAQWFYSITPQVVELVNKNLCRLVGDGGGRDRERFVGEEITIVSG